MSICIFYFKKDKHELQTGMKILNASLVCREHYGSVWNSAFPSRGSLCAISIRDVEDRR